MSLGTPDLSIVIPSYNEELRLPATLEQIAAYLPSLGGETEILVVDDGSKIAPRKWRNLFGKRFRPCGSFPMV